jgi:hypothetical protein
MLYNICKNPDSLEILKNDLVWFAVEVAAKELQDNLQDAAGAASVTFVVVWLCLLFMFPGITLAGTGVLILSLVGVL